MRMVYQPGNAIDGHVVRHALEHAGIPARVRGDALLDGRSGLPEGLPWPLNAPAGGADDGSFASSGRDLWSVGAV